MHIMGLRRPPTTEISDDGVTLTYVSGDEAHVQTFPRWVLRVFCEANLGKLDAYEAAHPGSTWPPADFEREPGSRAHVADPGAYAFARNVLTAVIDDLIDSGASAARAELLLHRVAEANESMAEGPARQQADAEIARLLAVLRAIRE